jgi:hypothetical protein
MGKLHEVYRVVKAEPTLGADPEAFVKKGDMIVASETVLPPAGLPGVVRDGVQVEFHPVPFTCRANLANSLAGDIKVLHNHLKRGGADYSICLTPVVELSEAEMAALPPNARVLGCQPSLNIYDPGATVNVPANYPIRSAGGHIHIGLTGHVDGRANGGYPKLHTKANAVRIIQAMDILVGNTCVLLDRDKMQPIRREVYGRAGEYRLPSYGVEYRTLSNFWLQAHPLWSLVGGLTKLVVGIFTTEEMGVYVPSGEKDAWGYDTFHYSREFSPYDELLKRVSPEQVRKAIDQNDVKLAWDNWQGVRDWIETHVPTQDCGLSTTRCAAFEHVARTIQAKAEETGGNGLDAFWTPGVNQWLNLTDQHNYGWESFIDKIKVPTKKKDGELNADAVNAGL